MQATQQIRHPERSAPQMGRVTQRLWRGVEGPRGRLIGPLLLGAFQAPGPQRFFADVPETIQCVSRQILMSRFGGRKAPSSRGK
jgi:hypothetical protein